MKLELLQHTGSFKPRGAFNRLLTATPPTGGVVAASGGNHGAAVAYAARSLGITAEIFVPTGIPAAKLARLAGYGARVVTRWRQLCRGPNRLPRAPGRNRRAGGPRLR